MKADKEKCKLFWNKYESQREPTDLKSVGNPNPYSFTFCLTVAVKKANGIQLSNSNIIPL